MLSRHGSRTVTVAMYQTKFYWGREGEMQINSIICHVMLSTMERNKAIKREREFGKVEWGIAIFYWVDRKSHWE